MLAKMYELAMGILMLLLVAALSGLGFESVSGETAGAAGPEFGAAVGGVSDEMLVEETADAATARPIVVIDAGHGGNDPGKVGAGVGDEELLEKDINLKIAEKLREFLEAADVRVIMTREADVGLYGAETGNKKLADMRERCRLIGESGAALVVSIHQNSYHDPAVRGPQVFYYAHSKEGKALAEAVQGSFAGLLGAQKQRVPKGNQDYYLLLHVEQPIVIVECGFLSNPEEAAALADAWYQEKVAWSIHLGILQHLNREKVA